MGIHKLFGEKINDPLIPEGDYSLTTALIPTHAVDAGDIRYSVTVDDHVVVDQWKLSTSSQSYCHY